MDDDDNSLNFIHHGFAILTIIDLHLLMKIQIIKKIKTKWESIHDYLSIFIK